MDNKRRLQLLTEEIDKLLGTKKDNIIVAIDGRCASGKTTLASELALLYECNVFHMDDYFLRPEQRTQARLNKPGENVDHERFGQEVMVPLSERRLVWTRKYDCHRQMLLEAEAFPCRRLNIVEGTYSLHKTLIDRYDLTVFSDISPEEQMDRIKKRNSPEAAEKFFTMWIPMEEAYFEEYKIREKARLMI